MTAAERATALLKGEPVDCPRCGKFPALTDDLSLRCKSCGLVVSLRMAVVVGQPGDETAAIHLYPAEPAESMHRYHVSWSERTLAPDPNGQLLFYDEVRTALDACRSEVDAANAEASRYMTAFLAQLDRAVRAETERDRALAALVARRIDSDDVPG